MPANNWTDRLSPSFAAKSFAFDTALESSDGAFKYSASVLAAIMSGDEVSPLSSERTSLYSPRARRARNLRICAGSSFSEEKDDVSKSTTFWNWPWWKALWMFTSSGEN